MKRSIELTQDQANALLALLDNSVKYTGLQAPFAANALFFVDLIQKAFAEVPKEEKTE